LFFTKRHLKIANETGDVKLLGSFRRFIDRVKNDPNYKPSNPALAVTAMEAQYAAGASGVVGVRD